MHELHQATVHTLLNTPHDSSAKMKHLRGLYAQTFFTFQMPYVYRSDFFRTKNVSDKSYIGNHNTHFVCNNVFRTQCRLRNYLENMEQPGRPEMTIWYMRIACWIPTATDTIKINIYCFPLQQQLHVRASMLRFMYSACLVITSFYTEMVI